MAKRFGRNQRRQMREQIADLDHKLAAQREATRRVANDAEALRHRLTDWAKEILHLMGSDSAFNEQLRRVRNVGGMDPLMLSPVHASTIAMRDQPPQWERVSDVITACLMRCRLKSDDLRGQIALEISDHMGQLAAYALPEARRRNWSPRDIRYMAELIAQELAAYLLASDAPERQRA